MKTLLTAIKKVFKEYKTQTAINKYCKTNNIKSYQLNDYLLIIDNLNNLTITNIYNYMEINNFGYPVENAFYVLDIFNILKGSNN